MLCVRSGCGRTCGTVGQSLSSAVLDIAENLSFGRVSLKGCGIAGILGLGLCFCDWASVF